MLRSIQTAVAASASEARIRQIARALGAAGCALDFPARDAGEARQALFRFRPDLLVIDEALPLQSGRSLAARVLGGFEFPVRPAVLLIAQSGAPLPEAGAVLLDPPFTDAEFAAAVETLRRMPATFPDSAAAHADRLLDELGVPDHAGRSCLKTACLLCASDERLRTNMHGLLYPQAGEICGLTAVQAERAMRHVISLAWQSDKIENQYRIFRDTIDAGRGQPTCREMISRLADILRLEG